MGARGKRRIAAAARAQRGGQEERRPLPSVQGADWWGGGRVGRGRRRGAHVCDASATRGRSALDSTCCCCRRPRSRRTDGPRSLPRSRGSRPSSRCGRASVTASARRELERRDGIPAMWDATCTVWPDLLLLTTMRIVQCVSPAVACARACMCMCILYVRRAREDRGFAVSVTRGDVKEFKTVHITEEDT